MTDTRTEWLPDEAGSAGRENLDPDHVARYDAKEDAEAGALRAAPLKPSGA